MKVFETNVGVSVCESKEVFYIAIEESTKDHKVAKGLTINYEKYKKILIKYKAEKLSINNNELYFLNEEDAEKCINSKELEPYIVMNKLTGEN